MMQRNGPRPGLLLAPALLLLLLAAAGEALLFPFDNTPTRSIYSLDGLWRFVCDLNNVGMDEKWFATGLPEPTILMPVPASYNDLVNSTCRDHVGWVWYQRSFFAPTNWLTSSTPQRVLLRFHAAHYFAAAYINGELVVEHEGGHLPFEADITDLLQVGTEYQLIVAVNNTLTETTLPPGQVVTINNNPNYPPGYTTQTTSFDFFNYAGIDRSVWLLSTPAEAWVDDITIQTTTIDFVKVPNPLLPGKVQASQATLSYQIAVGGAAAPDATVQLSLFDPNGALVATDLVNGSMVSGTLSIAEPMLWEPCGMTYTHTCVQPSALYTLTIEVLVSAKMLDLYSLPHVGIRTVSIDNSTTSPGLLVNGQPVYLHGVDKHEDSDMRGKGYDAVLVQRDYSLLEWLHSNAYRTSHYPYDERWYQQADAQGIMLIDEAPAVGMNSVVYFSNATLAHHCAVVNEMISRDKNHPSVLLWSLANEPASDQVVTKPYWQALFQCARQVDPTARPMTFVSNHDFNTDVAVPFADLICINRYYAWYTDSGALQVIPLQLTNDLQGWRQTYPSKPIIVSEYGADTVPGMHTDPPVMFSEEFQAVFIQAYHEVFDAFRDNGLIGELIWNFADFQTGQGVTRVDSKNFKGIFTRQRQPKEAAFILKERYENIESGQPNDENDRKHRSRKPQRSLNHPQQQVL